MTFIARESFSVRGYEIGFTGSVQPSTLARYCEHARWGLFRDPVAAQKIRVPGGVARALTLAIESELTHPSDVVVSSWIARVGRTSLDFAHEVARSDGSVVATVRTTVVAMGPNGPVPYPSEAAELVSSRPAPAPLAPLEGAPDDAFVMEWVVRGSDQDRFRHVNQAKYVDFVDDARHAAAIAHHPAGFGGPLGIVTHSYERELHAGELASLRLWTVDGVTRHVEIRHAMTGTLVHRAALAPRGNR